MQSRSDHIKGAGKGRENLQSCTKSGDCGVESAGVTSSTTVSTDDVDYDEEENDKLNCLKENTIECSICLQHCIHAVQLPCRHTFCYLCVKGTSHHNRRCALCRAEIPEEFLRNPTILSKDEFLQIPAYEDGRQWYYEGQRGWWQYEVRASMELEERWKRGEKTFDLQIGGLLYVIDFEKKVQYRKSNPGLQRKIKRDIIDIPDKKGIAGLYKRHYAMTATEVRIADGEEDLESGRTTGTNVKSLASRSAVTGDAATNVDSVSTNTQTRSARTRNGWVDTSDSTNTQTRSARPTNQRANTSAGGSRPPTTSSSVASSSQRHRAIQCNDTQSESLPDQVSALSLSSAMVRGSSASGGDSRTNQSTAVEAIQNRVDTDTRTNQTDHNIDTRTNQSDHNLGTRTNQTDRNIDTRANQNDRNIGTGTNQTDRNIDRRTSQNDSFTMVSNTDTAAAVTDEHDQSVNLASVDHTSSSPNRDTGDGANSDPAVINLRTRNVPRTNSHRC